jgi:hypothetical protein
MRKSEVGCFVVLLFLLFVYFVNRANSYGCRGITEIFNSPSTCRELRRIDREKYLTSPLGTTMSANATAYANLTTTTPTTTVDRRKWPYFVAYCKTIKCVNPHATAAAIFLADLELARHRTPTPTTP